jgi:hypothetical protein
MIGLIVSNGNPGSHTLASCKMAPHRSCLIVTVTGPVVRVDLKGVRLSGPLDRTSLANHSGRIGFDSRGALHAPSRCPARISASKEVDRRALIAFGIAKIALLQEQTRTQTEWDQPQPAVNKLLSVCPGTLVKLGIVRRTEQLRIGWPSPAREDSRPTPPLSPSTPGRKDDGQTTLRHANPHRHP